MNKSILFKAMVFMVSLLACMAVTSCGDDDGDDDDDPADPTALKAVTVNYSTDATDDMLAFFDIKALLSVNAIPSTTYDIELNNWSFNMTYGNGISELPENVSCKIVATPKSETPTIDTEAIYSFKVACKISINGLRNDNNSTILGYEERTHPNLTIKGDKVQKLLDRGETIVIDYNLNIK